MRVHRAIMRSTLAIKCTNFTNYSRVFPKYNFDWPKTFYLFFFFLVKHHTINMPKMPERNGALNNVEPKIPISALERPARRHQLCFWTIISSVCLRCHSGQSSLPAARRDTGEPHERRGGNPTRQSGTARMRVCASVAFPCALLTAYPKRNASWRFDNASPLPLIWPLYRRNRRVHLPTLLPQLRYCI